MTTPSDVALCSVSGCGRSVHARTWCGMHYKRWSATGDPEGVKKRRRADPSVRFQQFLKKGPSPDSCWEWAGRRDIHGYGAFALESDHPVGAHRFSYELFVGPIPVGLQLDHLCRVRHCVNPAHLEPVTARENSRRSFSVSGINSRKTACPVGHVYDEANTYWHRGKRSCKECKREALRRSRKRRKTAVAA